MDRIPVSGSTIYSLAVKPGTYVPSGELSDEFSLQASWMKHLDEAMHRGNVFEDETMNPILDWVEKQIPGLTIHRKQEFAGDLFNTPVSGHPDWIFDTGTSITVIDCKRGSQHRDVAYLFQPGLYAKAIEEGLIPKLGKRKVDNIGTTFFNNDAAIQVANLYKDALTGRADPRESAHKIVDALTGKGSSAELSAVRSQVSAPLSDTELQSSVATIDRLNQATMELTGMSPKDLFGTVRPGTYDEEVLQQKQRQRLEQIVKFHLAGFYSSQQAKNVIAGLLGSTGGKVLGDRPGSANTMVGKNPQHKEYIFFDLETGGFPEQWGGYGDIPIVSFGYQIFDANLKPVGDRKTFIINDSDKAMRLPEAFEESKKIHGVSIDSMQASPHTLSSIMPEIQRLMQGRIPAGYNIDNYDIPILAARGIQIDRSTVDVAKIMMERYGHHISLEKAFQANVRKQYAEAHEAAQDAYDTGLLYKSTLGIGKGMNPNMPDYGNIHTMPQGWEPAPNDLLQILGQGTRASVYRRGPKHQIALHDESGNIFMVGRLAKTSAGWTINGKAISQFQTDSKMQGNPIIIKNLYQEVMHAYGLGGPQGVREAQKVWNETVKNMTVTNRWSFLSPARAAQIRSAAVRNDTESAIEWYKSMRKVAEDSGDQELLSYVYRTMDSKFLFDVVKTVNAFPLSLVDKGQVYMGSAKAIKTVQQMAREQAMSTDMGRNKASMFRKPGEGIEYGVSMTTMEAGFLPEGSDFALDNVNFYQGRQKYVANEDEHEIVALPRSEWQSRPVGGQWEVSIARDTDDGELLWVRVEKTDDIKDVEVRRGKDNKYELGYVDLKMGSTSGGQVKFWHNKSTLSELSRTALGIQTNYKGAIELLQQISKNPRLAANAYLSAEFNDVRENDLWNLVAKHMSAGRPLTEADKIPITQADRDDAALHHTDLSRRTFFIKTGSKDVDTAIGKAYAEFRAERQAKTGPTSMHFPMDFMYYKALKLGIDSEHGSAGYSLPVLSTSEEYAWERDTPNQVRQIKVTIHDPMIAKALQFATLLTKEGTASLPAEMVTSLFDKYGSKIGRLLKNRSERDREPYQDLLRAQAVSEGAIDRQKLITAGGRSIKTIDDLRKSIDINGNFMAQLRKELGVNYLYVDEGSSGGYYLSGEMLQFMATPDALNRMKKNIWAQRDENEDAADEDDVEQDKAAMAVNSSLNQLKWLLRASDLAGRKRAADSLHDSMFGREGLANMKGVVRSATGMTFPARYSAQGTVTSVPGMSLNEVLLSNDKLQQWFPGVSMDEINRVLSSIKGANVKDSPGVRLLLQRYPNIANAITALPAFRVTSEEELIRREDPKYGGYARKRGFTGIGMSPMSVETIFEDFDGDQVAAFLSTIYKIGANAESGDDKLHIIDIENDPNIERLSSFPGRVKNLAFSIGVMTGDNEFIRGNVSISRIMERIQELGETGTNITEIGKWMTGFKKMNHLAFSEVGPDGLPVDWNTSLSVDNLRDQYQANAYGKRQMGSTYNRMVRDLGIASEDLVSTQKGDIVDARDPRAWANRMNVMVHQLSVDMIPLGKSMSLYMEMTERLNPFGQSGGSVEDERNHQKFSGTFEQATWKVVELLLGSQKEFRGVGKEDTDSVVNKAWRYDMARGITNDEDAISKIEGLIGRRSLAQMRDPAEIRKLTAEVKALFGDKVDTLMEHAGGMVAVPVNAWMNAGKRSGGSSYVDVAGGALSGKKDWAMKAAAQGERAWKFRKISQGDKAGNPLLDMLRSMGGEARWMAQEIYDTVKESAPKRAPSKDAWMSTVLRNITAKDDALLSMFDALVNNGEFSSFEDATTFFEGIMSSLRGDARDVPEHGITADKFDLVRQKVSMVHQHLVNIPADKFNATPGVMKGAAKAQASSPGAGRSGPEGAVPWSDMFPHGFTGTTDKENHVYLIPKDPRLLDRGLGAGPENEFLRRFILGGEGLTEDERVQYNIGKQGTPYAGVGSDLVGWQKKQQEGKLTSDSVGDFKFKFARDAGNGISSEDMTTLFENSKMASLAEAFKGLSDVLPNVKKNLDVFSGTMAESIEVISGNKAPTAGFRTAYKETSAWAKKLADVWEAVDKNWGEGTFEANLADVVQSKPMAEKIIGTIGQYKRGEQGISMSRAFGVDPFAKSTSEKYGPAFSGFLGMSGETLKRMNVEGMVGSGELTVQGAQGLLHLAGDKERGDLLGVIKQLAGDDPEQAQALASRLFGDRSGNNRRKEMLASRSTTRIQARMTQFEGAPGPGPIVSAESFEAPPDEMLSRQERKDMVKHARETAKVWDAFKNHAAEVDAVASGGPTVISDLSTAQEAENTLGKNQVRSMVIGARATKRTWDDYLKHAAEVDAVAGMPASVSDIGSAQEANPQDAKILNKDQLREMKRLGKRSRPGVSRPSAPAPSDIVVNMINDAWEKGLDQDTLQMGMGMYSSGQIPGDIFDYLAESGGVKGAPIRKRIDTAKKIGQGRVDDEIESSASGSRIGEGGAVGRVLKAFGGSIESVTEKIKKQVSAYDDLEKRLSEPAAYDSGTKSRQRGIDRRRFGEIEAIDTAINAGGDPARNRAAISAMTGMSPEMLSRMQNMAGNDQNRTLLGSGPGGGGGLFGGNLGQLAWGLIDVNRIWNMTGGNITEQMSKYAQYSAGKQAAQSTMGSDTGWTGAALDTMRSQSQIERAGLQVGKAGQDMFGWIPRLLGGGADPDSPGPAAYGATTLATMTGGATVAGIGSVLFKTIAPEVSKGMATLSGVIGKAILPVMFAELGIAVANFAISKGGADPTIGDQYKGDIFRGVAYAIANARTLFDAAGGALNPDQASSSANIARNRQQYLREAGFSLQKQAGIAPGDISGLGKSLESRYDFLKAGAGDEIYQNISLATGISGAGLKSGNVRSIAEMIANTPSAELSKARLQLGSSIAYTSGLNWGSDGFGDIAAQANNLNMGQVMQAQDSQKRIANISEYARRRGITIPGVEDAILGKEELSSEPFKYNPANPKNYLDQMQQYENARQNALRTRNPDTSMDVRGQTLAGQYAAGDQRAVSLAAAQYRSGQMEDWAKMLKPDLDKYAKDFGIEKLMTVNPATGLQIGQDYGGAMMMRNYGSSKSVAAYSRYLPQMNLTGDTGTFNLGSNSYALSDNGMQQASYEMSAENARFQQHQTEQHANLNYSYTTGRQGPFENPSGAEFSLGGPVTIKIGNQSKIVTDTVTGEAIQGRGQWQMEDWQRAITRTQQSVGFGFSQEGINLNNQQFQAQLGLQKSQFAWQTNWEAQGMGIQKQKMEKEYTWGKEDIAFQGNQSSLHYAWGLQDIDEELRYATGRDRRKLLRQRGRETVDYSMNMGQLGRQDDRLDQRHQWDEQEFTRQKAYFNEKIKWQQQEWSLSERFHNSEVDLSQRQLDASIQGANETYKLQDEATKQNRKYWTDNNALEVVAIQHQATLLQQQLQLQALQLALGQLKELQMAGEVMIVSGLVTAVSNASSLIDTLNKKTTSAQNDLTGNGWSLTHGQ